MFKAKAIDDIYDMYKHILKLETKLNKICYSIALPPRSTTRNTIQSQSIYICEHPIRKELKTSYVQCNAQHLPYRF